MSDWTSLERKQFLAGLIPIGFWAFIYVFILRFIYLAAGWVPVLVSLDTLIIALCLAANLNLIKHPIIHIHTTPAFQS